MGEMAAAGMVARTVSIPRETVSSATEENSSAIDGRAAVSCRRGGTV